MRISYICIRECVYRYMYMCVCLCITAQTTPWPQTSWPSPLLPGPPPLPAREHRRSRAARHPNLNYPISPFCQRICFSHLAAGVSWHTSRVFCIALTARQLWANHRFKFSRVANRPQMFALDISRCLSKMSNLMWSGQKKDSVKFLVSGFWIYYLGYITRCAIFAGSGVGGRQRRKKACTVVFYVTA